MRDIAWLTSRPIAHRGYHDAPRGVLENSPSAVEAALARGFSIEVDLQPSADGKAMVFHDDALDRLTFETGDIRDRTAAELTRLQMRGGDDRLWVLEDLLGLVDGKVGLCIELKSRFARRPDAEWIGGIARLLQAYPGPVAVKSFDPDMLELMRAAAPEIPRGALGDGARDLEEWGRASRMDRFILRNILYAPRVRPSFVSWWVKDLPALAPSLLRRAFGLPIITWTVRTAEDRKRAAAFADQIVFEGFDADAP
ncbi:MAG: glycerophosphodiester phosphodiesterase [Stappia sp.]|uniref:glycerophosphodiester phosphodiesterase family protein n=1 Tax=Stappia sp. TaxID=1870903 RepID=UPI000C3AFE67|nr:glycerophosphodiester phosphodiesterase family protein [Stappia sp.]MAA98095.1 glycerophosphodiester phosphodiesterase [Stappia sp.]MBM18902.1 glycerophosphodiester phosphodiesterase [Stappia sp.]